MSQLTELLELERRKLMLLRNKLAEQQRRVQTLESMDADLFDSLIERELAKDEALDIPIAGAAQVEPTSLVQARVQGAFNIPAQPSPIARGESHRTPRKVPQKWVKLLRYLGREGKTYDQVTAYIDSNGICISHGAARTQLMNYRKNFGFVENPTKGFMPRPTER